MDKEEQEALVDASISVLSTAIQQVAMYLSAQEQEALDLLKDCLREVESLCASFLGEGVIDLDFDNDGPDHWYCKWCLEAIPVVYLPSRHIGAFSSLFRQTEAVDIEGFPHAEDCEVRQARRILMLIAQFRQSREHDHRCPG